MIEHDVEQGSPAWLSLRLGIPTASEFHKIVTPKGKLSEQARGYAIYLITETLLNRSLSSLENLEWVERGKALEPEAVKMYEFTEGIKTRPVGFITTDDGRIGASPDRLWLNGAFGVEIKCPAPHTHVGYMLDGWGDKYKPQVQGQMLVGDLEGVDRYSFSDEMPPVLMRTVRDIPYIRLLRDALDEFCHMKDEMLEKAKAAGFFIEREEIVTPVDAAYEDLLHDASAG